MRRRSVAAWVAIALLAGCSRESPRVVVSLAASPLDLAQLARVHVVMRECGVEQLALIDDIPIAADAPASDELEVGVAPGRAFYIWAQGWSPCAPVDAPCTPESEATAGACTCFEGLDPPKQVLVREACSPWTVLMKDDLDVSLRLEALAGRCPPGPLSPCP